MWEVNRLKKKKTPAENERDSEGKSFSLAFWLYVVP